MKSIFNHPIILSLSGIASVINEFVRTYMFSDYEFLKWLVIVVSLDLISGIAKVWAKEGHQAITSKGIRMTVLKFIQYGAFIIVTHIVANAPFGVNFSLHFVEKWAYSLLLLIEIKSVYENITAIDNRLDFLKPWLQKLTDIIKAKSNLSGGDKPE
jgi:hypothetical protein